MNSLQKDFLQRSIINLENLTERAEKEESLSPEFLRETFRALHTIKGTSQTFGFASAANLAHELENLLSAKNDSVDFKNLLVEGFALLIESFRQTNNSNHKAFTDKIRQIVPASSPSQNSFSNQIPPEISKLLSEYERNAYVSALDSGKKIFCVKADFDFADFAIGFKNLKENLSSHGEIIATLPNPQPAEKGKIGFLIYFAGQQIDSEIQENFPAEVIGQTPVFSDDVNGILAQVAAHGKDLARKLGKEVEITITADKIELSTDKSKLIFDILLHLVRNATDHAIEIPEERIAKGKKDSGTIDISLEANEDGLNLSVKDDGKGIDSEKLRAKAVEKNLVSVDEILTESELLDLIFLHELSTSETISEISGRGVGLGAVKDLAENAGGKISVESVRDVGTTFAVILPKEN